MKIELSLIVKSACIITENLIELVLQPMEQLEERTLPNLESEDFEMAQQILKQAKKIMPTAFTGDINISKILLTHSQYEELDKPTCGDVIVVGLERGEVIK